MTKARLRNYQKLKKEQKQLRAQLKELEAALYYPKIPHLTDMPKGGHDGNPQENMAIRHIELQAFYNAKIAELEAEQLEIEKAINSLDGTERMILRYKYLDGLKWEEVCVEMGYCWTQIHEHHGRALRKLAEQEGTEE